MRAIQIENRRPSLVTLPGPPGDGVRVRVVATSICGSDLHMIDAGMAEGRVLGHEFAGIAEDGTAVAVIPTVGCGSCTWCQRGYTVHCETGQHILGVSCDGGLAEYVNVPPGTLFALPSGISPSIACLLEPLAVAAHGLTRARVTEADRVLVIGAGPIGLAASAVLGAHGVAHDVQARHDHQVEAVQQLGGNTSPAGHYDVVLDAVGSSESLAAAIEHAAPLARIGMLGSFWQPASMDMSFCTREVEVIASACYVRADFETAGHLLADRPGIAAVLISHRFPLEAVDEAFATATDRASGAIKVVFEP